MQEGYCDVKAKFIQVAERMGRTKFSGGEREELAVCIGCREKWRE